MRGRLKARRAAVAGLAAVASVVAGCGQEDDVPQVPADRPNVVVVMTDDQVIREVADMPYTSHLFEREGVAFENFFATFPLCCPSRVTFLTGQYAHNHGILSNKAAQGGGYANYDDEGSLPVTLERAGYRTGFVGKYLNGYDLEDVPRGWTYWAAQKGGFYNYELNVNGEILEYGRSEGDYQTDVESQLAAGFVRESADAGRPFFLFTAYHAPHGEGGGSDREYNPQPAPRDLGAFDDAELPEPPSFDEADLSDKPSFVRDALALRPEQRARLLKRVRSRSGSLLAVDDGVRAIMRALRDAGVADNTYVFFTSDNGYLLGEHRQSAKTLLYEESLRVPLLALGPRLPAGVTRSQVTGNIDLAPTIYDIAGVEPGREQDGISLLPLARNPGRRADRDILIENATASGVHTGRWVYIEHRVADGREYELYDLARDPYQLRNAVNPESGEPLRRDPRTRRALAALRERLAALRDCAGASCR